LKLISRGPADTEDIGLRLGMTLKPGDVVALYGDLGSGKTTMTKGLAGAFGIGKRDITSASYTIIAAYETEPPFYHIDLYRIEEGADLDNTGVWDCMGRDSVAVIEWAERLGSARPDNLITVTIKDAGNNAREISIEGGRLTDMNKDMSDVPALDAVHK